MVRAAVAPERNDFYSSVICISLFLNSACDYVKCVTLWSFFIWHLFMVEIFFRSFPYKKHGFEKKRK